jgi:hypothetical protein
MQGPYQSFPAWLACVVVSASVGGPVLAHEPDRGQEHATHSVPAAGGLTLANLEQMALRGNPTLSQAAAQIEAARGRAVPAGTIGELFRRAPGARPFRLAHRRVVLAET